MSSKFFFATSIRRGSASLSKFGLGLVIASVCACGSSGRSSSSTGGTGATSSGGSTGSGGTSNGGTGPGGGSSVAGAGGEAVVNVGAIAPKTVTKVAPGLNVDYYEQGFDALPDFTQLTPSASVVDNVPGSAIDLTVKVVSGVDLSDPAVDQFALRFTGLLFVPIDGDYVFGLQSDDGSKLLINDQTVVDNDHIHEAKIEKQGMATLKKGFYGLEVQYFENSGGQSLSVSWTQPGKGQLRIRENSLFHACTTGADCVDSSTVGAGGAGGAGGTGAGGRSAGGAGG